MAVDSRRVTYRFRGLVIIGQRTFHEVYRTYFKVPMPAPPYFGVDHRLGDAKFEDMGIAVKR